MRIAVVDDESAVREGIMDMISRRFPGHTVCGYASGEELLRAGEAHGIVFLDILMQGMGGMEAARALRRADESAVIVFITGTREHVFDAFDVSAFNYLLKPVEEQRLYEVLQKALTEAARRRTEPSVLVRTKARSFSVPRQSVLYAENRGKKVELHTTDRVIALYSPMREMEEALGCGFYRCHRGYLVNMAHIREYSSDRIGLSNGESIYLARERYNDFVKAYMRFLSKGGGLNA